VTDTAPDEAARPADADDIAAIHALALALRAELADHRGGALWIAHDALAPLDETTLAARLGAGDLATFVGTLDGHPLAYALAHTEPVGTETLAVIDEISVSADARTVGLGETLLDALVTWAADHGALGIDATALPGDREAKNFFEAHGFRARRLVMHRPNA
jgi:GNAT superfamily N-acetyltransferase